MRTIQGSPYRTVPVFRPGLGTGTVRCTERYTQLQCATVSLQCATVSLQCRYGTVRSAYRW
ncbi:unnamed protein product, partial [Musa hybrid cultivar]